MPILIPEILEHKFSLVVVTRTPKQSQSPPQFKPEFTSFISLKFKHTKDTD